MSGDGEIPYFSESKAETGSFSFWDEFKVEKNLEKKNYI